MAQKILRITGIGEIASALSGQKELLARFLVALNYLGSSAVSRGKRRKYSGIRLSCVRSALDCNVLYVE